MTFHILVFIVAIIVWIASTIAITINQGNEDDLLSYLAYGVATFFGWFIFVVALIGLWLAVGSIIGRIDLNTGKVIPVKIVVEKSYGS